MNVKVEAAFELARSLRQLERMMMLKSSAALYVFCAVMLAVASTGCPEQGPMEKAGEKVDEAAGDLKEAAEDVAE